MSCSAPKSFQGAYLVALALALSACATTPESSRQTALETSEEAVTVSEMMPASSFMPEVTAVIVESTDAFDVLQNLIRARAMFEDRDFHGAAKAYQTVWIHDPKIFEARIGFADSLYALGRVRLSYELIRDADAQAIPNSFVDRAETLEILIQSHLDPTDETARVLMSRITAHPGDLRLYIRLARQLDIMQKWAESRAIYRKAQTMNPENAALRNNFGMSLLSQGQTGLAKEQFLRASKMETGNILFENNRRLVTLIEGDQQEALSDLPPARQARLLTDAASLLERSGELDKAQRFYEEAVRLDPSYNPVAIKGVKTRGEGEASRL